MDDEDCERRRGECLDEMTDLEKQFHDLKDKYGGGGREGGRGRKGGRRGLEEREGREEGGREERYREHSS